MENPNIEGEAAQALIAKTVSDELASSANMGMQHTEASAQTQMENLEVQNEGRILDHEKVEQEKAESMGDTESVRGIVFDPETSPPTDGPALDEAFRVEDAKGYTAVNSEDAAGFREMEYQQQLQDAVLQPEAPDGQRKIGSQDPAHKIHWHGKDIVGNEYIGSGNDARQCNIDAGLLGSCTCHMVQNPDYVEPVVIAAEPEAKPISAFEANDFYRQGYADGDAAYQDIKTLILAWVTEQMVSSSPGAAQDVDSIPFVVYARHNR